MVKSIILFLLFGTCGSVALATDTVYVSDIKNSYLVFDEDVSIVDLGVQDGFVAQIEKNAVFVKALTPNAVETTLFVTAGPKVYAGVVCFRQNNEQVLYDFRERTLNTAASYNKQNYVPQVDISLIRERLYSLSGSKRQIEDVGIYRNKVSWSLTNVMTDNSAIYLKLRLENQSSLVYRVESVSVENAEFYRKRFLSRKKVNMVPVVPLIEGNIVDIKPYSHQDYFIAIPTYAVGEQGAVFVTIRETSGVRSLQLEISPSLINSTDLF